jgi:hypothetical protein
VAWPVGHRIGDFRLLERVSEGETIARGGAIREVRRLHRTHGRGRWRKLKGEVIALHEPTGRRALIEVHWYEAHGIGVKEEKTKRVIEWLS